MKSFRREQDYNFGNVYVFRFLTFKEPRYDFYFQICFFVLPVIFFSASVVLFKGPAFLNESDDKIAQRIAEDFPSFGAPTVETVAQLRHQRTSRATTVRAKEYYDVVPLFFLERENQRNRVYF